jgi:hypothetical protein
MEFDFNLEKNDLLLQERDISFYQIIETIEEKGVLLDLKHPNEDKFPNQFFFVIEYEKYTYCVPYVIEGNIIFLKTIFPCRKFLYLLEKDK